MRATKWQEVPHRPLLDYSRSDGNIEAGGNGGCRFKRLEVAGFDISTIEHLRNGNTAIKLRRIVILISTRWRHMALLPQRTIARCNASGQSS